MTDQELDALIAKFSPGEHYIGEPDARAKTIVDLATEVLRLRRCVVKAKGALVDVNLASVYSGLPDHMYGAPASVLTGWHALWGCINRVEEWVRIAIEDE